MAKSWTVIYKSGDSNSIHETKVINDGSPEYTDVTLCYVTKATHASNLLGVDEIQFLTAGLEVRAVFPVSEMAGIDTMRGSVIIIHP